MQPNQVEKNGVILAKNKRLQKKSGGVVIVLLAGR